ncbi:MAG: general stress protein [Bacillus sp. (in: Bacteria)]|nr:general stress protein [Bacillus sp. (in: firmicutes)]
MGKHVKSIIGVYETEQEAIAAIQALVNRGYNPEEISVIGKDHNHVDYVTDETGTAVEETAANGAIAGGAVGGVTGLLAGLGALAIPGIGPIIAAGPIAASLIGALTGAGLGGLTGALIGLGIPDDEAEYYGNSVEDGKILVLVQKKVYHPNDVIDQEQEIPIDVEPTHNDGTLNDEGRFNTIKERNSALDNKY